MKYLLYKSYIFCSVVLYSTCCYAQNTVTENKKTNVDNSEAEVQKASSYYEQKFLDSVDVAKLKKQIDLAIKEWQKAFPQIESFSKKCLLQIINLQIVSLNGCKLPKGFFFM